MGQPMPYFAICRPCRKPFWNSVEFVTHLRVRHAVKRKVAMTMAVVMREKPPVALIVRRSKAHREKPTTVKPKPMGQGIRTRVTDLFHRMTSGNKDARLHLELLFATTKDASVKKLLGKLARRELKRSKMRVRVYAPSTCP